MECDPADRVRRIVPDDSKVIRGLPRLTNLGPDALPGPSRSEPTTVTLPTGMVDAIDPAIGIAVRGRVTVGIFGPSFRHKDTLRVGATGGFEELLDVPSPEV